MFFFHRYALHHYAFVLTTNLVHPQANTIKTVGYSYLFISRVFYKNVGICTL